MQPPVETLQNLIHLRPAAVSTAYEVASAGKSGTQAAKWRAPRFSVRSIRKVTCCVALRQLMCIIVIGPRVTARDARVTPFLYVEDAADRDNHVAEPGLNASHTAGTCARVMLSSNPDLIEALKADAASDLLASLEECVTCWTSLTLPQS